jgi:hypothetical protein
MFFARVPISVPTKNLAFKCYISITSLMSSTDTTSLGLKAIVARNATKLNETVTKEKTRYRNKQNKQIKQNKTRKPLQLTKI